MPRTKVLLPALAVAVLAAALDAPAARAPAVVRVSMGEWGFALAPSTAPRGAVVFRVTNTGTIRHNFQIAGKRTPALDPGRSATLRIVFEKPGVKRYLCTLPSHAEAGMRGGLRIA